MWRGSSSYVDAIVVRDLAHDNVIHLAEHSAVPVVNGSMTATTLVPDLGGPADLEGR